MASSSRDGVKRIGTAAGRLKFEVRLVARHPDDPKRKIVDTVRVLLADSKAEALRLREKMLADEVAKKLGTARSGRRVKFAEAADGWHATLKRHGTATSWGSYVKKLKETFGERYLDSMRADEMQRYLAQQQATFAHSTVKGIRAVLVRIFEWAIDEGHIPKPSAAAETRVRLKPRDPHQLLEELEHTAPPKMGLDHSELARFMPALQRLYPEIYTLVLVQLALGARFSEASALKRSDIDMVTGKLVVRRAQVAGRIGPPKKDKMRAAALPLTALELVRGHLARMDELKWPGHDVWVFPASPTDALGRPRKRRFEPLWWRTTVGVAIKATMKEVGVSTVNATHFARHTLNGLIRGHVADSMLRAVVGHASEQQSAAYGDAQVLDFAAEVERVVLKQAARRA